MTASGAGAALVELVSTAGSGIIATGATVAVGLAYRVVRPYFKASVNCHFCNTDCKVKYNERNSWYCPYCGQYNGFTADGDYNQNDHLFTSTPVHMYTQPSNRKSTKESSSNNGLCKKCNLNQELKMNQLASYSDDESEFEDYKAHLERVYRLCAGCEAVLAERIGEQNSIIAPGLLEHKLETSRILASSSHQKSSFNKISVLTKTLCHIQIFVAVMFFLMLLHPHIQLEQYQDILPDNSRFIFLENIRIQSLKYEVEILISLTGMLATLGLILGFIFGNPVYILNVVPFILENFIGGGISETWRLASALSLCTIVPGGVMMYRRIFKSAGNMLLNSGARRILPDTLSAKLMALDDSSQDLDETLTSRDSITTSKSSFREKEEKLSHQGSIQSPQSTIGLFTKLTGFVNASETNANTGKNGKSRMQHSPLLVWSGDQGSTLNHEFFVHQRQNTPLGGASVHYQRQATALGGGGRRECDLISGLTLGSEERNGSRSAVSPFSQRVYSPTPNPEGIRFTPSRPILRPAQLTSWVAGGYWSPLEEKVFGETHSRSSSQSSGFVSTGLLSGSPSLEDNMNNMMPGGGSLHASLSNLMPGNLHHASLPTSRHNSILGDFDRNSVLSAPIMKRDITRGIPSPVNQSFITQRRNTTDEQLSESSIGRVSQIELSKLLPNAQSSPNCSIRQSSQPPDDRCVTATPMTQSSGGVTNTKHNASLYDNLSFTVTITPVGFILVASLTFNFALMYYFIK